MNRKDKVELSQLDDEMSVKRISLAEIAAQRLRDLVLVGTLPPGQALSERELSDKLQISRTPLREAIRELAAEKLIEILPNRRPRVADPSTESINDLFDVQAALEALAGKLLIQRATNEKVDRLAALHKQLIKLSTSKDSMKFFRLDMEYHTTLVQFSDNSVLAETHRQYNAALFRARYLSSEHMRWRDTTMAEHEEIMEAILARDAARLSASLTTHLMTGKANHARLRLETEAIKGKGKKKKSDT
ncbi:DNA-binding transcriptional regulator, GntR family [Cohaesibacter sp. ES.047]|uniref:GntR family transcriptional regulator n=1 Tax=Cohaesibacter sp. ES.047 TaxID=1798205 RepID=UPI000BB7F1D3|nr:GntR family transcriptional regulator [Cohaesibacter sp. ES.047]SNY93574.1 DNA-binding transcriptional regulator, GntR family [Cohaesibacter sp. ES.047]